MKRKAHFDMEDAKNGKEWKTWIMENGLPSSHLTSITYMVSQKKVYFLIFNYFCFRAFDSFIFSGFILW